MKYGLPFVPVAALAVGLYFFLVFRKQIKVKHLNVAEIVKTESKRLGPMLLEEYLMAVILVVVIGGFSSPSPSAWAGRC